MKKEKEKNKCNGNNRSENIKLIMSIKFLQQIKIIA